ncbi:MAG: hypothetical protein ACHQ2Z_08870 [Elusimicrobiota bacterium]
MKSLIIAAALALSADAASAQSGLWIGRCALGQPEDCLRAVKCGLIAEDRASVRLSTSGAVLVDSEHVSPSENFAVLKRIALSADRTRILVLSPRDKYSLRVRTDYPSAKLSIKTAPMGHPDTSDGFLGYTFFQYRGSVEDGIIYAPGAWTDVLINARQTDASIAVTLHHEFRHVVVGDFGRAAPAAKHGSPEMETAVSAAETEASKNAEQCF